MPTLRLHQLYVLFLALAFTLLAALGVYAQLSLRQITERAQHEAERAAHAEIARVLENLDLRLRSMAERLAAWDETRQHLANPEYYALWRDTRVRDTGALPATMHIALYRPDGRILASDPGAMLPARLPHRGPSDVVLRWEDERPEVYFRFPVRVHPDSEVVLGYGVIRLDPLVEIRSEGPFRYIDAVSLGLSPGDGQGIQRIADLARHLRLRAQPDPVLTAALDEVRHLSLIAAFLALGLALAFLFALRHLVVRPIGRLSAKIQALRDDPQADAPPMTDDRPNLWELRQLQQVFADYHHRLLQLHQEIQRRSHQFYEQARQDALTGVYNRRAFDEDRSALEKDQRVHACALLLFDCDHFKAINDSYGHAVGDSIIRALAGCLAGALRSEDRLYRLGGDEFATLMAGADLDTALKVAERCLERVRAHDFRQYGVTEPVNLSIGVAHGREPLDLGLLHRHADIAMYKAKQPGQPPIVVYDAGAKPLSALVDNREVSAVYAAIRDPNRITLRYQPIVQLSDGAVVYAEALCRIRDGEKAIGPASIFTIVQNRRLDSAFDHAVIAAVRRDLAADHPDIRAGVSINLSNLGIVDAQVIDALLALKRDFPERRIGVEITETALITRIDAATAQIARLRGAGLVVALDDFGSGYSSLRYLASMPVDVVKFDMSLVHLLLQDDARERLIVEDIAEIIATTGYALVAEGIESDRLWDAVHRLGFAYAQGFYVDRMVETKARQPASSPPG